VIAVIVYRSQIKTRSDVTAPGWLGRLGPVGLAGVLTALVATMVLLIVDQPLTQVLDDRVWLPGHTLTLKTAPAVIGYVLSDDGARFVVLEEHSRLVRVVAAADVTADRLCDTAPTVDSRSLWDLFEGKDGPSSRNCQL